MNLHLRVFGDLAEQPQSLLHILLGSGNRRVASCFDYSTKQSSHFFKSIKTSTGPLRKVEFRVGAEQTVDETIEFLTSRQ